MSEGIPPYLRPCPDGVLLLLHVQPGARQARILGLHGERLRLSVRAVAEKGKANEAVISFLVTQARLSRGQVSLLRGATARVKDVMITGVDIAEISARLVELFQGTDRQ